MSASDAFLERQRYSGPSGGGANFYKKKAGMNVGRLLLVEVDGVELPCFQFLQHSIYKGKGVPTERIICPKHFDHKAECEICQEVQDLYEEGENQKAGAKRAKKTSWFAYVAFSGSLDEEEEVQVLNLPHGATQRILTEIAGQGGWKAVNEETGELEPDWESDEFKAAFGKGVGLCFGPKARDLKFRYNPKGGFNCYPEITFSSRQGKELDVEVPNLQSVWMRVNQVQKPARSKETNPKAPPPAKKRASKKRVSKKRK